MAVAKEIIESTKLQYVDCVYFGWFTNDAMWDSADDQKRKMMFSKDKGTASHNLEGVHTVDATGHRIDIEFGHRSPAEDRGDYEYCLLSAMYAWDSNSFPGNEYYIGMLSASGDPAAAACSTIPYVQNSRINTEYITGHNSGVFFFDPDSKEYEFHKLGDMKFEENEEKWLTKSVKSVPYKRDRFAQNYVKDISKGGHSLKDDTKETDDDIDEEFLKVKADSLKCGSSQGSVKIVSSSGKQSKVNVAPNTTLLELYAHVKQLEKGKFRLLDGLTRKRLNDPKATMESLNLSKQGTVRVERM